MVKNNNKKKHLTDKDVISLWVISLTTVCTTYPRETPTTAKPALTLERVYVNVVVIANYIVKVCMPIVCSVTS